MIRRLDIDLAETLWFTFGTAAIGFLVALGAAWDTGVWL